MHDLSYILNELGEDRHAYQGAVAPPIITSVNFCFKTVAEMRAATADEYAIPFYTRGHNPTIHTLNQKLAALEHTEAALTFASGSAAVACAIMANVNQGDHVVCLHNPYLWTNKLLKEILPRYGVETTFVDGRDAENYRKAIRPNTKVLFLECPNSFTFELQDVPAIAAIAKEHGLVSIMDNSYASPLNMNPADMGVDIICHSATKYLGGHSDAVAGVVCCSEAMARKIFSQEFMGYGATISPFNAYLLLRGLRTLPLRMKRIGKTAGKVTEWLAQHPKVRAVHYPFLSTNPDLPLAKKLMKRGAGQFSIQLKTKKLAEVEKFCDSLERFLLGASWGSYESLIFPSCTKVTEPIDDTGYPVNFIRFCVGMEPAKVLIADLENALSKIEA